MQLSDVLYQDRAQTMLQRLLQTGRLPHAMLFAGPDGVGKEMLATRLAAVLLCRAPRETMQPEDAVSDMKSCRDSCGRCADCGLMAADNHPDFHRLYRALNKLHPEKRVQKTKAIELSIDVIRYFLIDKIGLRPSQGRAKVFIISEAERLSDEAQNAMLKTLEEPPPQSYLILVAPSPDVLQETIRSRCQQISFRALPGAFIQERLTSGHDVPREAAIFLSELSDGSLGRAIRYSRCGFFDLAKDLTRLLARMSEAPIEASKELQDIAKALAATMKEHETEELSDTAQARSAQYSLISAIATVLRDVQRVVLNREALALPGSSIVPDLAGQTSSSAIGAAIRAVGLAEYQIGRNAHVGLIFDALCIKLGRALDARRAVA